MGKVRRWIGPLALFAYVLLFAIGRLADPTLPPTRPLQHVDLDWYFFPSVVFLHRSLWEGALPLWNPHQLVGTPFLALHQPGVLYPPLLLLSLLPPTLALSADTILHLLLAAVFTWLLTRRLGTGRAGAVTAGVAFASSTSVTAAVFNTAHLSTLVWLPAALLAVRSAVERPRVASGALLALVMAMAFLGGYAQGFVYIAQAVGLYALYLLLGPSSWGRRGKAIAVTLTAALAAGALVSAQLLPSLEHASAAMRGLGGVTLAQATVYEPPSSSVWEACRRLGVWRSGLVVVLGALAIARRSSRREAVFFALLWLLAFDFMRGRSGFSFTLYHALPLGNLFRHPHRIGFVVDLSSAVLLGIGVHALLTLVSARGRWLRALALALPLFIALEGFVRSPRFRFTPLASPATLAAPPAFADLKPVAGYDRMFVVGGPPKLGTLGGGFVFPDYDPVLPGAYGDYFGIPAGEIWYGSLEPPSSGRSPARWTARSPELLDLLSVRYYVDLRGRPRPRASLQRSVEGVLLEGVRVPVFERARALPRVYVVHELVVVRSEEEALRRVRQGDFSPTSTAIVATEVDALEPGLPGAGESARIRSYRPQRVTVEASCASSCLLVLTDLFDPNWRVSVDGTPGELLRVNFLVRGVRLAPGEHRIVFTYEPLSFRLGMLITFGSVLLLLAAVAAERARAGRSVVARGWHERHPLT